MGTKYYMGTNIRMNGSQNGLLVGALLLLSITVIYATDLALFTVWWMGLIHFIVLVGGGCFTIYMNKRLMDGTITFREAFISFITPIIVGLGIYTSYMYILLNWVDLKAPGEIMNNLVPKIVKTLRQLEFSDMEIDEIIIAIKPSTAFGLVSQIKYYCFQIVFYSFIGFFAALIFKTPGKPGRIYY